MSAAKADKMRRAAFTAVESEIFAHDAHRHRPACGQFMRAKERLPERTQETPGESVASGVNEVVVSYSFIHVKPSGVDYCYELSDTIYEAPSPHSYRPLCHFDLFDAAQGRLWKKSFLLSVTHFERQAAQCEDIF